MSLVLEIGGYLATQGAGTVGTDLFEGLLPEQPDDLTSLFERPGRRPVRASAKTTVADRPGLQVLTRSLVYETGYTRIKTVRDLLQNFVGLIGTTRYLEIITNQSIHSLGTDELRRYLFSLNFDVTKVPS